MPGMFIGFFNHHLFALKQVNCLYFKAMEKPVPTRATNAALIAALFFVALFIRAPFFFRDYIDRDESTFILMGKSVADGHLPYVHLWDLKPPLLFYVIGVIEKLFPNSFIAIRFFGVLAVFASALLLMLIVRQAGLKNSFLTALLYVILSSELGSLQGLMSEHLAVLFALLAFFWANKKNYTAYFFAGLAFGCALLCKLSYAYSVVLFGFCFAFFLHKQRSRTFIGFPPLLFVGVLLPFSLMAVPYLQTGHLRLFFDSIFLAPLAYAQATQLSFGQKISTAWWVIALALLLSYGALRRAPVHHRQFLGLIALFLLGAVYTFFSSGIVNGHYLILAYPFILLLANASVARKLQPKPVYLAVFVLLISAESLLEYGRLWQRFTAHPAPYYRPAFTVVDELKKHSLEKEKLFFTDYHIGYWLLGQYPLSKAVTHPSNLARSYLFKYFQEAKTSLEELKFLLEQQRPGVIVSSEDKLPYFGRNAPENVYFTAKLQAEFKPVYENKEHKIFIWQRIKKE